MSEFKDFERRAWEEKADRYTDTWGSVTSQCYQAVLNLIEPVTGTRLLDLGCGPGDFCQLVSDQGISVDGCDYSRQMLEIAKRKHPKLNFYYEDAEKLSFLDNSYDFVTLNYLLLHVPDQERVLREASRVLKSSGKLAYTVWLPPTASPGLQLILGAIKEFADTSVIPPGPDIFLFSNLEQAENFFSRVGYFEIKHRIFNSYWKVSNSESFFNAVQAGTRMGGMIDLQKPWIKEKIKERIVREIEQFKVDTGYLIPTPSIIVSAKKR